MWSARKMQDECEEEEEEDLQDDEVKEPDSDSREMLFSSMEFLEQFADSVVDYSSRYNNCTSISYSPENVTGKPLKYPQYGDFPDTYILRTYGTWWKNSLGAQSEYVPQEVDSIESEDFITVRYEIAVVPTKIIIYETYNPGSVVRIFGRIWGGEWHSLYEGKPEFCEKTSRIFHPPLKKIYDIVNEIRVEFNQSHQSYHTSIDAILLAGYKAKSVLQMMLLNKALLGPPPLDDDYLELENSPPIEPLIDYTDSLPNEIMVQIFHFLDLKTISNCAQVNRRWREATMAPTIFKALSLKKYWVKIDNNTLKFLKKRCKTLRKLDLSWCGNNYQITEDVFQDFLKKCGTHLTHLSLCCCEFVRNVAVGQISKCAELVDLRLRKSEPSEWTYSLLSNLNKLVALDLYCTAIQDESLIKILKANPSLEHLNIDLCENILQMDEITETLAANNPRLVSLSCWKLRSLTPDGVKHIGRLHRLRELDMGWCLLSNQPGDCLERISQGCPDLRRLILSNWRGLSDHHLLCIIRSCKKLTQLDILGIWNITEDFCERVFVSLPNLQLFDISFCNAISQTQVKTWRETYPSVTIQRSESENWN
ncbi:PREDICTED: F-box/LRR-repeat protein 4 [Nicrophorus vespilloides]|uniref:F-box/LRR-repeat protein 4 n=1 Tax=Nicrophorus vespilloides TaxID=110193 RepID=A0ABM1MVR7_NICVS|nr:PREDICTED: F-box/LRR-repeat protein 4 [Nicrophorus vespilloides]